MQILKSIARSRLLFGMFIVVMLLAAACSTQQEFLVTQGNPGLEEASIEQEEETPPTDIPDVDVPTEIVADQLASPTEVPDMENGGQPESYPAPGYPEPVPTIDLDPYPSPEENAAPPPVKTGLEATDPASVILAAGKPQLIEFFAFW